jgi:uncharacterized protein (TIGR03435 family)
VSSPCMADKFLYINKPRPCVAGIAAALLMVGLVNSPRAQAQSAQTTAAPPPSFEVASIKSHAPGDNMSRLGGPDVSRFSAINVSVKSLIEFAYHVEDFQVSGGTGWIAYDKFDVDAKVEDSLAEQIQKLPAAQQSDQLKLMVQSLLVDRFKLSVTHVTKELPVFALVVAKGGPKLTEAAPPNAQNSYNPGNPPPDADAPARICGRAN